MLEILSWAFEYGAPLLAIVGFGVGLWQYQRAQLWKRSEFAASQLRLLSEDPKLNMCRQFLDWEYGKYTIPKDYEIYAESGERTFMHNWKSLYAGLRPESEKDKFGFPEMMYREYFDHFFEYLEMIEHYIDVGLVSRNDVKSLEYWLQQLASPRYEAGKPGRSVFGDFVEEYEYSGVKSLMKRYGLTFEQI